MRVLYFDTETTGLRPEGAWENGTLHPGQICQLAYLIWQDGQVTARNYYFAVEYIEPGASAVTGLTVDKVLELSQGKLFGDYASEIVEDFEAADVIVAHNLSFDERFMSAEMQRCGFWFNAGSKGFCSMKGMTDVLRIPGVRCRYKWPSLAELAAFYNVTDADVATYTLRWFGVQKDAHDARHDSVKMFLALARAAKTVPAVAQRLGLNDR